MIMKEESTIHRTPEVVKKYSRCDWRFMWRLVRGNILRLLGMFKDSHVWLQIMPENQMPGESGFSP